MLRAPVFGRGLRSLLVLEAAAVAQARLTLLARITPALKLHAKEGFRWVQIQLR